MGKSCLRKAGFLESNLAKYIWGLSSRAWNRRHRPCAGEISDHQALQGPERISVLTGPHIMLTQPLRRLRFLEGPCIWAWTFWVYEEDTATVDEYALAVWFAQQVFWFNCHWEFGSLWVYGEGPILAWNSWRGHTQKVSEFGLHSWPPSMRLHPAGRFPDLLSNPRAGERTFRQEILGPSTIHGTEGSLPCCGGFQGSKWCWVHSLRRRETEGGCGEPGDESEQRPEHRWDPTQPLREGKPARTTPPWTSLVTWGAHEKSALCSLLESLLEIATHSDLFGSF